MLETAERPCLRHQMGRCHAPCRRYITPEAYHEEVRRVRMFLEGRADLLVAELNDLMKDAAGRLDFERAAVLRDQIAAVTGSLERQAVGASQSGGLGRGGFVPGRRGGQRGTAHTCGAASSPAGTPSRSNAAPGRTARRFWIS